MTQNDSLPPPPKFKTKKRSAKTAVEQRRQQAHSKRIVAKRKAVTAAKRAEKLKKELEKTLAEGEKQLKKAVNGYRDTAQVSKVVKGSPDTLNVLDTKQLASVADDEQILEEIAERPVIFAPHPGPQTAFLAATEREVLYGGAAGGGKTMAMIVDPLRYAANGNHRAILFRHTNDELREIIAKSKEIYPLAYPGAKWSEQKSQWTFPSGATIWLTYLDRDDDVLRYQGQAFNWIGFDELTHWTTPYAWEYMRSRLRTADPTLPLYSRASTNPGSAGAWWVRKMFIDPAPWGEAFWATNLESGETLVFPPLGPDGKPHSKAGQPLFKRRFIPAKLSDNPSLMHSADYEANLLSLPEVQRRRLLEGDWDIVEGAAFSEFSRAVHVVTPYEIPTHWTRFRGADWGYSSPGCVLWFAVTPDRELVIYRELYFKGLDAEKVGAKVLELEASEHVSYGVLDVSAWSRRGDIGPSIAETMNKMGCRWKPSGRIAVQGARNSRISGKMEVHKRLAIDPLTKKPRLTIFSTCTNLIRTLPILPLDENDSEDVDTEAEDHAYDALRYGVMSRPIAPPRESNIFGDIRHARTWQPSDPTFGY
jgi:hypothetical protein